MRIGHGFDVHKFGGDGPIVIGGVSIDYEQGLVAHSDGDVLLHALCDALLGAAALGDIGKHFPDTDDAYSGADSRVLLRHVVHVVNEKGYTLGNADMTIVAQAPKMAPHIEAMRAQIAEDCNVDIDDIFLGNGVSELIVMANQALLNDGDEVLVPSPDYPLWTAAVNLAGGKAVHYVCDEQSDWMPDIDDIKSKLDDKTLSAAQLTSFLSDSRENTQIIYRNLTRAADLISSFKQVAVDQTAGVIREIKLHEYLDEIINSMQPTLKKYRHIVTINCDESITIKTKPGPLNQIIINLIMNSITHGFKAMEQGQITINATLNEDKCIVNFIDNGCGIEEKIKQKVFDPFVTTSRGEGGSGLGLHLVYNLVTQALKGNISVVSELKSGAQFTIEFPAYLQENSHD